MREVLIFGNGLGMALDPDYFRLASGLKDAWGDLRVLSPTQKRLINNCLKSGLTDPVDIHSHPESEEQLDTLQRIVAACDYIHEVQASNFSNDEDGWLTQNGQKFPSAIRKYIHRAASYFQAYPRVGHGNLTKFDNFTNPLAEYLKSQHSHVVTLNYDKLMYGFIADLNKRNDTTLTRDGFLPDKNTGKLHFSVKNLLRSDTKNQAYYLHLHGSPLFIGDRMGNVEKIRSVRLPNFAGHESIHIVLTSVPHKRSIISASSVLSVYWERFEVALKECEGVTLFGYSGLDEHLNTLIKNNISPTEKATVEKPYIRIVEWIGNFTQEGREAYWQKVFNCSAVEVILKDNILDFSDWQR